MNPDCVQIGATKNSGSFRYPSKRSDDQGAARSKCSSLILIATLCVICALMASGQSEVDEYRLKAAFLFHFAQFVEWPPGAITSADGSLIFCVVGEGPFHGELEGTVQGRPVSGRTVRVRHIKQTQDGKGCQLLFIDRRESSRVHEFIAGLASMPILTVGESDDFLEQGGSIRFCMEDRKVRFEVNQQAAQKANLTVSSRLLLLAKRVVGSNGGR